VKQYILLKDFRQKIKGDYNYLIPKGGTIVWKDPEYIHLPSGITFDKETLEASPDTFEAVEIISLVIDKSAVYYIDWEEPNNGISKLAIKGEYIIQRLLGSSE
jgi:hypothetical protein